MAMTGASHRKLGEERLLSGKPQCVVCSGSREKASVAGVEGVGGKRDEAQRWTAAGHVRSDSSEYEVWLPLFVCLSVCLLMQWEAIRGL